jgi:hypothetical protein
MVEFKLEGIEEFKAYLEQASDAMRQKCMTAVNDAALKLQEEAIKNLHNNDSVRTGALASSIIVIPGNLTASCETNIKYALYLEYGTGDKSIMPQYSVNPQWKGMKPKPYWTPAFEVARNQFMTDLNNIVNA